MKTRKGKKRKSAVMVSVLVIMIAVALFFQFTSFGYRMTVSLRGFVKAAPHVYIHQNFTGNINEVLDIVNESRQRVNGYFGEIRSNPTIIICDDLNVINKLGGDHDTMTAVIFNVYSYIVVSSEYLNTDIVAHEMTHAEVHKRLFNGKIGMTYLVPTWFDEGFALQNDYREIYNGYAWITATDDGKNGVNLNDISTAVKFYAGETEERRYRYIVSKHELTGWIERNGTEALFELLDNVNQGKSFNDLFFANRAISP
ncbi:MAG: hypothetical protein FWF47_01075 [Clostridia bacterium]|nr:hypothetical protein [Clostridia bacterium]